MTKDGKSGIIRKHCQIEDRFVVVNMHYYKCNDFEFADPRPHITPKVMRLTKNVDDNTQYNSDLI